MRPLGGVLVAAIAPRRSSGHEIDLGATLEVVDFLSAAGVEGIALLGSTGEFVHFDIEDRIRLSALVARRSRVPVLVNVSHSTLDGALKLAEEAASAGVAGVLIMPPYYFRYDQDAVKAFLEQFARQIGPRAPVYLYNIPFFTTEIASATACELLASGAFAGIKDSSGRWEYFEALRAASDQRAFTLLIGNDTLFTRGRSAGASGVVSGVACALPELMVALDRAIVAKDNDRAGRLDTRLTEFIAQIDRFPAPVGVKEAAALRGVKAGPHATPLGESGERRLAEFREWFAAWWPKLKTELDA